MPSTKRPNDETEDTPSSNKHPRTEQGDFSGNVKKKLTGASRTGQACDRCKVRKIRCDARPGGCSPCAQNNTECRTTDRITGRATSRGYTENIEAVNSGLKQHVADLRRQLQDNGIDPHPAPAGPSSYAMDDSQGPYTIGPETYGLSHILNSERDVKGRSKGSALPDFRSDSVGDNYLGVSSANDWPLPVTGTHHALFGMHLDLKDFTPDDSDDKTAATSHQSFLQFAFACGKEEAPALPPYQQLRALTDWFFRYLNPWLPVLHKPRVMAVIDHLHQDPEFKLNMPQTVQLHLMLASILYQYSARNGTMLHSDWRNHYRFALSFYPDLIAENSFCAMQAVTLLVTFLRALPRPGAAWMISSFALTKAIEMGLHRSVTAWDKSKDQLDAQETEMRKRVFWSLLSCHVMIGAKLGRPLMVRIEDFDIELPQPVHDYLPQEEGESDWRKCSFQIGIYGFKMIAVYMQIYTTIYTVRPVTQQPYEHLVKKLEKELDDWYDSMPVHLASNPNLPVEDRVFKLYMDFCYQHLRLLLHHPALCRTPDQQLTTKYLDICLDASSHLLEIASAMRVYKSLDTTWFNMTVFLAAIFTSLFANLERKDDITSSDFTNLKASMDQWLDIMGDVGHLLGSGSLLQKALQQIVLSATNTISNHLAAKTASAAVASAVIPRSPPGHTAVDQAAEGTTYHAGTNFNPIYSAQQIPPGSDAQSGVAYLPSNDTTVTPQQQQHPYTISAGFAYPDPAHTTIGPYASHSLQYPETYNEDVKPDLSAQLAAHTAALRHQAQQQTPQPQQQQITPQPPSSSSQNFYGYPDSQHALQQHHANAQTGSIAWRHFADDMMNSMTPHWSANALMALQNQPGSINMNKANGQPSLPPTPAVGDINGGQADVLGLDANAAAVGAFDFQAHPQNWPTLGQYQQTGGGGVQ